MQVKHGFIYFINLDPLVYDGLGEIHWIAPAKCGACGNTEDFSARSVHYDGCLREIPECNNCGAQVLGLPVEPQARAAIEAGRAGNPPPAKKTKHVTAIQLDREFTVYDSHARRNTTVWIFRDGPKGKGVCDNFETNPVLREKGKISEASVLRVKRAQNQMLAAIANQSDE